MCMAPTPTTTLRLPVALRDDIARLADERGSTLLDVVADAVDRLKRDQWWAQVHQELETMTPGELAEYHAEVEMLDTTTADGLRER